MPEKQSLFAFAVSCWRGDVTVIVRCPARHARGQALTAAIHTFGRNIRVGREGRQLRRLPKGADPLDGCYGAGEQWAWWQAPTARE